MTGPEHYRKAEELLAAADKEGIASPDGTALLSAAQVHATLALAAAVGTLDAHEGPNGGSATGRSNNDQAAWERVTGEHQ